MENEVILSGGHPLDDVNRGKACARVLTEIVEKQKDKVTIGGKTYIQFSGWQMIARFYRHTVGVEWTKPLAVDGKVVGFHARAVVYNEAGNIVSSAEAMCNRDESRGKYKLWEGKPDSFMFSMSQTRASTKALRNVFSWVAVLAGYQGATEDEAACGVPSGEQGTFDLCSACGETLSHKVSEFSVQRYGKPLCIKHQGEKYQEEVRSAVAKVK